MQRTQEIWTHWQVSPKLSGKYSIDFIQDDDHQLALHLSLGKHKNPKVHVYFKNAIYAFRKTDEGFMYKTIIQLEQNYGASFYTKNTFFKIENSAYLQWLTEQSHGLAELLNFSHFCFLGENSIVDVIASYEPEIALHEV